MLSSDDAQPVMARKLQNEPYLQKMQFPEACLCALVLHMNGMGEVLGMFCVAQLISQTICGASHRIGIEVPHTHLPARVRGSRWLFCSTRAPMN